MVKPEGLGSRSHGEVDSGSTLGTTHGYMDERLPLPRRRRQNCSPSSVKKVQPFDSGDAVSISRWTCCHQWWCSDVVSLAWRTQCALWMWPSVSGSLRPHPSCSSSSLCLQPRWHRVNSLLLRRPIRCKWAPQWKELVISCISLRCTCHGTVWSLNRSPTTSRRVGNCIDGRLSPRPRHGKQRIKS
jgi:hypothetical protein